MMDSFESAIRSGSQSIENQYTVPIKEKNPASSAITRLSVGEEFYGEVTDVSKGTVTLRLDNGQSLQARLQGQYKFNIGEKVMFEVKSNDSSLVEIRPVIPGEQSINQTILKALAAAEIPVNDKTVELLKNLLNEQMPIDKSTLNRMYKLVLSNNSADTSSIVQMSKFNLPVTEESISQFENYKNFNHQISSEAEIVSKELSEIITQLADENNIHSNEFTSKILDLILPDIKENVSDASVRLSDASASQIQQNVENTSESVKTEVTGTVSDDTDIFTNHDGEQATDSLQSQGKSDAGYNSIIGKDMHTTLLDSFFDKQQLSELSKAFELSGADREIYQKISDGNISVNDMLMEMKNISDMGGNLKFIKKNKTFQHLFAKVLENNMLLSPQELQEESGVERYYSRLKELTSTLGNMLEMVGKEMTPAAKGLLGMADNIDFMNQLNQMFTYVQLPLKLSEQSAHGDLYVYTKKKELSEKNGKITAMLHLDMTNLGSMDIFAQLENNSVDLNFKMENEDALNLMKDNIDILIERLEKRGYVSNVQFDIDKIEDDFVDDFLEHEQLKHQIPMQRFSFDVKA